MSILVTIPVVTYNAAEFVVETLESIFNQTHQNIQLIISDDCSKDNTVELVEKWCDQTRVKERFADIRIITVPNNTGVAANMNRCIKAGDAEWINFIAGDDILLPNCIEDNLKFVSENQEARIIFSQVKIYQDTFEEQNFIRTTPLEFPNNLMHPNLSANDQYQLLLLSDRIHYTPSFFCNKNTMLKFGGFNEDNRLVEDYPMWLKLTKSGEKLYYFHKETVGYRIHKNALNNVGSHVLFKPQVIKAHKIRQLYAHPYLPWEIGMREQHVYNISLIFQKLGWNKKTAVYSFLYRLTTVYLNPFQYVYAIKKRVLMDKDNHFKKH
jgi:alpha-1,3-rhamnosyltransferase